MFLDFISGLLLFALIFGISEGLRRFRVSVDVTRKVAHVGAGASVVLFPMFLNYGVIIALGIVASVTMFISKKWTILKSIHGDGDKSVGAVVFAPALTVVTAIFLPINPLIVQGTASILAISDTVASVVGRRFGKNTFDIFGKKTFEGSMAFLTSTTIILLVVTGFTLPLYAVVLFAFLIACSEALVGGGWDNVTITATSALALFIIL